MSERWLSRAACVAALLVASVVLARSAPAAAVSGWAIEEGSAAAPTAGQRLAADRFAAAARAALRAWPDPARAMAAGYEPQSEGEVVHFLNPARLVSVGSPPDPARPSALVFVAVGTTFRLAGAMWVMGTPGEAGTQFGGSLTRWHVHLACRDNGADRPVREGEACRPGEVAVRSPAMLHVWRAGPAYATDMTTPALLCTLDPRR